MPEVVAGQILAVRGKLDREADVGTAMQPVQEPLDGRARDQLQVLELGQQPGIDHLAKPDLRTAPASAACSTFRPHPVQDTA